MRRVKIIIEKHKDGYVAYPVGLKGVLVAQGDSFEEALDDVRSAIRFHMATFRNASQAIATPLEAFVGEVAV
ncbi:MAG: type II toxin-antitoxin system HicB family antitoxin [Gemmataceae bacterium]